MAFGEAAGEPPPWSVDVSTLASSLAKQASGLVDAASAFASEASTFASEAVTVKTRGALALRSGQHTISLARRHRDLGVQSSQLEGLVTQKRRELEESLVRIEELQAEPLSVLHARSIALSVYCSAGPAPADTTNQPRWRQYPTTATSQPHILDPGGH